MNMQIAVLDASVGVKWFKEEVGTGQAEDLLEQHRSGELALSVTEHFLAEVIHVVHRQLSPAGALRAWSILEETELHVERLTGDVVREAIGQSVALGCDFYDALAPALAALLDAPLYSADRRAHQRYPEVRFLGE